MTLATLYSFPVDDGHVLVPTEVVQQGDELAWCERYWVGERAVELDGRAQMVWEVPKGEWDARCHAPMGLDAPELVAHRLLDLAAVARLAKVSYATAVSYFNRRDKLASTTPFPEPVARVGASPVWSAPVVTAWLASRPGQGAGGGPKPGSGARQPGPVGKRRGSMLRRPEA